MPVQEHGVSVGHCYETGSGQVRRVTALDAGQVTYETLDADAAAAGAAQSRNTTTLATFAADAEQETECPPIDKGTPSQAEGEDKPGM